jgi:hypothetical protein
MASRNLTLTLHGATHEKAKDRRGELERLDRLDDESIAYVFGWEPFCAAA